MIVADTNLVSYLLIEGERTEAARKVYMRDSDWRAPPLWRSDFLNVLTHSTRVGVLDERTANIAWTRAVSLLTGREISPRPNQVLRAAIGRTISAYDAQFVAVAAVLQAPLVSGDKRLVKACPDVAISIEGFAEQR